MTRITEKENFDSINSNRNFKNQLVIIVINANGNMRYEHAYNVGVLAVDKQQQSHPQFQVNCNHKREFY